MVGKGRGRESAAVAPGSRCRRCSSSFGPHSFSSISTPVDLGGWTLCAAHCSPFLLLLFARSPVVAAPRRSPLLPIGFAVFLVHLATIPITGTGINPARGLGDAIIFNRDHAWN
ncbi:uncharacterized protein LOC130981391 [Arachis stenosperma]|uniref:uncharacterized protein LOC130981391 n=1 Tax=Arachis stenosperma TaxID=217475 RepID=UPI0025AD8B6C|nr:uncharacterized protein LOC130981391 [Arachis stenosperma]